MNRRFALIQVVLSLAALAAVVWWGARQHPPELPDSAGAMGWILAGVALYAVGTLVRAERWRRILHDSDVEATRADAYALTTVGYMGNNVLPARAGEMLRVVLLSRQSGTGKRKLLGTIVAERILDAVVLAAVFIAVVYGILSDSALPTDKPLLVAGAAAALLLLGIAALQIVRRHPLLVRVREFVRPLAHAPRKLVRREGTVLLALTVVIWGLEAAVYLSVGEAVALDLSPMEALYLVALTNFFAALPAAPGSIGTFDAAVVFGMKAIGEASMAVSYLLMLRFVLYVPITLVGLVVLIARYGGWSRLRESRQAPGVEPTQA
ncbi:MAG: lysylphosphatidylglycerol synthase transmembrane domain-containing protein [Nocardioidaceae bacterium]